MYVYRTPNSVSRGDKKKKKKENFIHVYVIVKLTAPPFDSLRIHKKKNKKPIISPSLSSHSVKTLRSNCANFRPTKTETISSDKSVDGIINLPG